MSIDDDLRSALRARAQRIEPGPGGWDRIQDRLADERRRRWQRTRSLMATAAVAVTALAVGTLGLLRSEGRVVETGPAGTPTSGELPNTVPPPGGPPPMNDVGPPTAVPGVWPFTTVAELEAYEGARETRYDDPVDVTRAFAVEYLGMVDPVVGEPEEGEAGTAKVVLRPRGEAGQPLPTGAMDTTVVLSPSGPDGPWNVLYATSSNIGLDGGHVLNQVESPVTVSGRSRAFEGTVQVEVRQAGMEAGESLGTGFVTGGAGPDFGHFAGEVAFRPATTDRGALVLYTESAADGSVLEATVVIVTFAAVSDPGTTDVTVFLTRGEEIVPVVRTVPRTTGVLRAALEQLLAGPTAQDRSAGLTSMFSEATAGMLGDVTIGTDGTAVVDFADLRPVLPDASTSTGSDILLGQLDATVFQFPTVTAVDYRINGSCQAFWEWLQRSCHVVARTGD